MGLVTVDGGVGLSDSNLCDQRLLENGLLDVGASDDQARVPVPGHHHAHPAGVEVELGGVDPAGEGVPTQRPSSPARKPARPPGTFSSPAGT
jgi:hypothetical protein